jgi:hypothetical protein
MFVLSFMVGSTLVPTILKVPPLPLQPTGNNFELHRSCHRRIWHQQRTSFAGVIGPLVEVPALIALVNVAFGLEKILSSNCIIIKSSYNIRTILYLKISGWFIFRAISHTLYFAVKLRLSPCFLKKIGDAAEMIVY